MGKPEPLWKALNCTALMIGVGAVLSATAAANLHGNAEVFPATLCVLFVIFAQLAANCAYRSYDLMHGARDERSHLRDMRSNPGFDRLLFYKVFGYATLFMALMIGVTIVSMGGWWFAVVGVFICIAGWLMVSGSTPIILTPWSGLFSFLLFGPMTVLPTSMLQSFHETTNLWSWYDLAPPIYMSVAVGLLAANANLAYNYATYFIDKSNQRDTFTATFGRKTTRSVFLINSIVSVVFFSVSRFWVLSSLWEILVGLLPAVICLIVNLLIWRKMRTYPRYKLVDVLKWACFNVLLMGILSLIVSSFIGASDDSYMELF